MPAWRPGTGAEPARPGPPRAAGCREGPCRREGSSAGGGWEEGRVVSTLLQALVGWPALDEPAPAPCGTHLCGGGRGPPPIRMAPPARSAAWGEPMRRGGRGAQRGAPWLWGWQLGRTPTSTGWAMPASPEPAAWSPPPSSCSQQIAGRQAGMLNGLGGEGAVHAPSLFNDAYGAAIPQEVASEAAPPPPPNRQSRSHRMMQCSTSATGCRQQIPAGLTPMATAAHGERVVVGNQGWLGGGSVARRNLVHGSEPQE